MNGKRLVRFAEYTLGNVLTARTGGVYMVAASTTKVADATITKHTKERVFVCFVPADQAFVVQDREEDTWWLLVAWDPSASASPFCSSC